MRLVLDVALNNFLEVSRHLQSVANWRQMNVLLHASELFVLLAEVGLIKRGQQLLVSLFELG